MHCLALVGIAIVVLALSSADARVPRVRAAAVAAVTPPWLTAAAEVERLFASRARAHEERVARVMISSHRTTSGRRFDTALVSGQHRPETMRSHGWAIRPYTGSPVSSDRSPVSRRCANSEVFSRDRRRLQGRLRSLRSLRRGDPRRQSAKRRLHDNNLRSSRQLTRWSLVLGDLGGSGPDPGR